VVNACNPERAAWDAEIIDTPSCIMPDC